MKCQAGNSSPEEQAITQYVRCSSKCFYGSVARPTLNSAEEQGVWHGALHMAEGLFSETAQH